MSLKKTEMYGIIELLLRQLSEAQEKCFSYKQYLEVYCDIVWRKTDNDEPKLFCMQLPSNYPFPYVFQKIN